ncbi:MAG: coproporphyrinogen dehydrogenase HemZ, partial [Lachnospiraceae bacterium]|nr:coproporphyrinogen dehydrogenase HemZ [Lachnospiraceae bacterium]
MISVLINEAKFEYDIHSLMKAFYPEEDVKVVLEGTDGALESDTVFRVHYEAEEFSFYEGDRLLEQESVIENATRIDEKNAVKRLVYKALVTRTGHTLVWGDLTGIRPTKIPRKMLDEGKTDGEILSYMKETYLVGDEKANLSLDIAKREINILKPLREKGYSIYVGIPFCPTTCLYCSFTSNPIAMWRERVSEYLNALKKEIDFTATARAGQIIDTVYIGGGTLTTLSAEELDELLSYMEEKLDLRNLLEFTVEAGRADSITVDKLAVLHRHHVTRISVNP